VEYEVKGDPGLGQASIPRLARTARSSKVKVITFNEQLITVDLLHGLFVALVSILTTLSVVKEM